MDTQPLTPPQDAYLHSSLDTQEDEDTDFLKKWLRSRGITIDTLLCEHNRVTIPIEEDIRVLGHIKELVEELPATRSVEQGVADYFQQLKEDARASERRFAVAASKYYMLPLPYDLYPEFHSFLRSRSSNSTAWMISHVLPHLIDETATVQAPVEGELLQRDQIAKHGTLPMTMKRTTPSTARRCTHRIQKPIKRERTGPSPAKQKKPRKRQDRNTLPLRRSSRLQNR